MIFFFVRSGCRSGQHIQLEQ